MKKLFYTMVGILILTTLFSSCSSVDSTIVNRSTSTTCRFLTADAVNHLHPGYQSIAGPNTDGTYQVCDSFYKVKPNFHEKVLLAKHLHTVWSCYLLIALGILVIILGSIWAAGSGGYAAALVIMLGIAIIGGGLGSIGWSSAKESDIPVSTYNAEMSQYGNLEHWQIDEGNLYK